MLGEGGRGCDTVSEVELSREGDQVRERVIESGRG